MALSLTPFLFPTLKSACHNSLSYSASVNKYPLITCCLLPGFVPLHAYHHLL